jgi:hypothetical protein
MAEQFDKFTERAHKSLQFTVGETQPSDQDRMPEPRG